MDYRLPDADLSKGHPKLQQRIPGLLGEMAKTGVPNAVNKPCRLLEVYRPDLRQQWLYGQGRTAEECLAKGVPAEFARPGPVVTNAWSAKTSAHGYTINGKPMACAVDLLPVEDHPWQDAEFWTEFVGALEPMLLKYGMRHFHAPGKQVWDKPHIQLIEWDDLHETLS